MYHIEHIITKNFLSKLRNWLVGTYLLYHIPKYLYYKLFSLVVRVFCIEEQTRLNTALPPLYMIRMVIDIGKNEGKRFEDNWKSSCDKLDYVLLKRLNDNASAWSGGSNTRFASKNECDFILFDSLRCKFFGLELKSTIHKSLTFWREDFEEYEERRESSADNAVFPDKVTKRNNEYIFGEKLRREKGEELCERCRAVRGRKKR